MKGLHRNNNLQLLLLIIITAAVNGLIDARDIGGDPHAGPRGSRRYTVPGEELLDVGEDVVAEHHWFARDEEAVELLVGEELAACGGRGVVGEEKGDAEVGIFTLSSCNIILLVEC